MDIKWRPIPKNKSLQHGMFLLEKNGNVSLVSNITPNNEFKYGLLHFYAIDKKLQYLVTDWITHYVRPSDLTDEQIVYLYKQVFKRRK